MDFAFQFGATLAALDITAAASATSGPAPLLVDLSASGGTPETLYLWSFGDGTGDFGADVSHTFTDPGLYPVVVRAIDQTGTGAALVLITAYGPGGAGPGTTPPGDATLLAKKILIRRNLKKPGKDSATLVATLELPAGFVPGSHEVAVSVAGMTRTFPLDPKNKGRDAGGNKVKSSTRSPRAARHSGRAWSAACRWR